MESQSPLTENLLIKDVDDAELLSSLALANLEKKPVKAKSSTRKWAAWTREEEENFFIALRQVGKNFEKITCRVQSKNKNQVRHYYYRLVRRMNKLLGPNFCLDAKNSKETNSAMLRWWSLLEKHNCTASKLHLKPRRFKIFIEALENQLLKDSKKRRKRRTVDIYLPGSALLGKGLGSSTSPVKEIPLDSASVKLASSKGLEICPNINFSRKYLTNKKALRQKQRQGLVASAAYKRWEKAAIAGVSLVAEAAEHLERTRIATCSFSGGTSDVLPNEINTNNGTCPTAIEPCRKLKFQLQLFPVDECTRRALERDEHNPHLELTLSARKRISSVLEHLNRKWGNSSIAIGELVLFPYNIQEEDLTSSIKWTFADTVTTAAEVYAIVGSPTHFRLRYGWFSTTKPGLENVQVEDVDNFPNSSFPNSICELSQECPTSVVGLAASVNVEGFMKCQDRIHNSEEGTAESLAEGSSNGSAGKVDIEVGVGKRFFEISCGEWAACLTNFSVGDLLNEASAVAEESCTNYIKDGSPYLEQDEPSCDSFDVAIAAHVSDRQLSKKCSQPSTTSIFNAEETCDEFSFCLGSIKNKKGSESSAETPVGSSGEPMLIISEGSQKPHKVLPEVHDTDFSQYHEVVEVAESIKHTFCEAKADDGKDTSITDVYWPDSLGPLDLDIASANFRGQELVFDESLSFSSFSRLFSNSLDAI